MHAYNTNSEHVIDDPNGASVIVLDYNTNRYEHVADSFDDVNEDVSCRLLTVSQRTNCYTCSSFQKKLTC
jgi:hypothetical protein